MNILQRMQSAAKTLCTAFGIGISAILLSTLVTSIAAGFLSTTGYDPYGYSFVSVGSRLILTQGTLVLFAVTYLAQRENPLQFAKLNWPSERDMKLAGAGIVGMFAVAQAVGMIVAYLDVEAATHFLEEAVNANPQLVFFLLPATFLLIAPAEELLYRSVIQSRLRETFSALSTVILASGIFASVHIFALLGQSFLSFAVQLTMLFLVALGLGIVYEYSESVGATIIVHGVFNTVVLLQYYSMATA